MTERTKLHCHGEYSKNDAVSTSDMVNKAAQIGAKSMTLTDHGSLMGIPEFMDLCDKAGIKGIPGIELYIEEDNDILKKKMHLILLAKDVEGYKQISKISTNSYKRLAYGKPRANKEMLLRYIKGGHVICTSACMQGVLAVPLLFNTEINKLIEKNNKKIKKIEEEHSIDDCYKKIKVLESMDEKINQAIIDKNTAEKESKGTSTKRRNSATKKFEAGSLTRSEYDEIIAELDKEDEIRRNAAKKALSIKEEIASLKRRRSEVNAEVSDCKEIINKINIIKEQSLALEKSKQTNEEMYQNAYNEAVWYKNMFGEDFYVELQYHGIEEEKEVMPTIYRLAKDLGIKVVFSNDAHFPNKEDSLKRRLLRMADFDRWLEEDEAEKELYLKTDAEIEEMLRKILPEEAITDCLDGLDEIEAKCNVVFPKEDHYPKFCENAATMLRKEAVDGIYVRYPELKGWTKEHKERLEYELGVITKMGFADYLLIVADFLKAGYFYGLIPVNKLDEAPLDLEELKAYVKEHNYDCGAGIGPGRGSAVGSLVCYLLGITNLDPIKEQLLFERFLNSERVTMPDIDSDFSSDIREKVIEYVKNKYGESSVCGITTKGTRGARAAVRTFASIRATKDIDQNNKALVTESKQKWAVYADKLCKCIPQKPQIKLSDCFENFKSLYESENGKTYKEIVEGALLLEGSFASYGVHAAGVIIADNSDVSDYIPLMWNSKKERWTCQCNMVQVEEAGLLKMDFLGLKNLKIITDTLREIKEQTGKNIDINQIPFEKEVFSEIYSKGQTAFVFQFESDGMRDMCRQFGPDKFSDVVLLNAAYRPGPMQYLPKIIETKRDPKKLDYLIPELEPILGNTYGSIIYQEQVMKIFQSLAGYSLGQADLVRRAMSKKKTSVLEKERDSFINGDPSRNITGCKANGIDENKANKLFDEMTEFAKYAFNKSHAAAYSQLSYITAWFKYHYPKQYLCSVMNLIDLKEMPLMVAECKKRNITLKAPDINMSQENFVSDKSEDIIYYSISKIKNVGIDAESIIANRGKGYVSFEDFIARNQNCNKKKVESLIKAGAFDEFSKSRDALLKVYAEISPLLKNIEDGEQLVRECDILLENFSEEYFSSHREDFRVIKDLPAKRQTLETKKERALNSIRENKNKLSYIRIYDNIPDDTKKRLSEEMDMIGVYVSAHPMDDFGDAASYECESIENLLEQKKDVCIMGVIKNYKEAHRKSDGKKMAFFDLEDKTSDINVCVFVEQFLNNEDTLNRIDNGSIVKLKGDVKIEIEEYDDEIIQKKSFIMSSIEEMQAEKKRYILSLPTVESINEPEIHDAICKYRCESGGRHLLIFDESTKKLHKVSSTLMVTEDFIDNLFGLKVTY